MVLVCADSRGGGRSQPERDAFVASLDALTGSGENCGAEGQLNGCVKKEKIRRAGRGGNRLKQHAGEKGVISNVYPPAGGRKCNSRLSYLWVLEAI